MSSLLVISAGIAVAIKIGYAQPARNSLGYRRCDQRWSKPASQKIAQVSPCRPTIVKTRLSEIRAGITVATNDGQDSLSKFAQVSPLRSRLAMSSLLGIRAGSAVAPNDGQNRLLRKSRRYRLGGQRWSRLACQNSPLRSRLAMSSLLGIRAGIAVAINDGQDQPVKIRPGIADAIKVGIHQSARNLRRYRRCDQDLAMSCLLGFRAGIDVAIKVGHVQPARNSPKYRSCDQGWLCPVC